MRETRLRLVASIALLNFLFSTCLVAGHAQLPFAVRSCQCSAASVTAQSDSTEPQRSGCKHCRAKKAEPEQQPIQVVQVDSSDDTDNSNPCPCHGGGEPCPHCPAGPGGCMFCNPAKVPCHLPLYGFVVSPPRLIVGYFIDSDQLFTASPCSKLFRPPRA